jgi:ribosome-associated translation inhibitor RaiA
MYAAIDVVEGKLKAQATKYKERYEPRHSRGKEVIAELAQEEPPE